MADTLARRRSRRVPLVSTTQTALTAAANSSILKPSRNIKLSPYSWQQEAWAYSRDFGPLRYGLLWLTQAMSRVRLTAAVLAPGGDEPVPLESGPAVDIMASFFGGTAGQSQYMRDMSMQLSVPGEGYVVAEKDPDTGTNKWRVASSAELRVSSAKALIDGRLQTVDVWEVLEDEGIWRKLPYESYVFRQHQADPEFAYKPDSPVRGVLRNIRTIDLLERRITATTISRLASNGLLLYPQEVTFPAKEGYEDAQDAFTAEWLDIASRSIENPGTAQAGLPLPVKVPREYIKDFVHVSFENGYDERLIDMINQQYEAFATGMNMPKEILTGMGDVNHWSAWALDEQGIKVHISPLAERLVGPIADNFLIPTLRQNGFSTSTPDGNILVWFDTSELQVQPDRSAAADEAYDRGQLSPDAYLREKGFGVGDKPDKAQLLEMLLLQLAQDPASAPTAIKLLTGTELDMPKPVVPVGPAAPDSAPETQPAEPNGAPEQPSTAPAG